MKVFLAEKEMVAQSIAKAFGVTITKGQGFYKKEDLYITWSYGHLVGLATDKEYGYEKWSFSNLPILPEPFKLKIIDKSYIKKQFKVIGELFKKADEIIVATDAGREGELIYRYIYNLIGSKNINAQIKRLWISDHTKESIIDGVQNMKPASHYDNLYLAAKARGESDWIVGINLTQCISLASKKQKTISVGRVQTATLRIIVDRYIENVKHEVNYFYTPHIKIKSEDSKEELILKCTENFESEEEAKTKIKITSKNIILSENKKKQKEKTPLLFNLTLLQRVANRKYQFTADQTLNIAQSLYEKHKLLSYPRTESQYLPENQKDETKIVLENCQETFKEQLSNVVPQAIKNIEGNSIFDNTMLTDHYAIIPTKSRVNIDDLTHGERIIYKLVVQQFVRCFHNPVHKTKQEIQTKIGHYNYKKIITVIDIKGWKAIQLEETKIKTVDNFKDKEELIDLKLSAITTNEKAIITAIKVEKSITKPKALYNDDTLLEAMSNAGKFLEDSNLKKAIKITGIGTSATRAETINTLLKREYIKRVKNKFTPTKLGVELIASIKELSIASVEMTALYEAKLKLIEIGKYSYEDFLKETKAYVKSELPNIKRAGGILASITIKGDTEKNIGVCPICKKGKIQKNRNDFYSCSNYKAVPSCSFTISGKIAKKTITVKMVKTLIEEGITPEIKGFTSKANNKFSAVLVLSKEGKVEFKM